ncbi:hypothetical protein DPEC_G00073500 [Dallia pectoralis]|uniref:Uncharacterized protein n=1 Tax=Dallia pectoralis TaxID=75939 RepID=A0ACC2H3D9_DALPE|nr:hypothetical protein DPEC_G00073500 [Dallia pectoralis]
MGNAQSPTAQKRQTGRLEEDVEKKRKKTHPVVAAFRFLLMLSCSCNETEDYDANSENVRGYHNKETSSVPFGRHRYCLERRKKPPDRTSRTRKPDHGNESSVSRRSKRDQQKRDPGKDPRTSKDKKGRSTSSRTTDYPGWNKTRVKQICITPELAPSKPSSRHPTHRCSGQQCCRTFSSLSSALRGIESLDRPLESQVLPGVPSMSFPEDRRDQSTGKKQAGSIYCRQWVTIVDLDHYSLSHWGEKSGSSTSCSMTSGCRFSGTDLSNSYPSSSDLSSPDLSSLGSVTLLSAEAKTDDESDQDHNSSIQHLSSTQGCQKSPEINIYPSATVSQMDQSSSRDLTLEIKKLQDWSRSLEDLENEVQRVLMENVSNDPPTDQ